ncbi:MAG: hypothetical protein J6A16_07485 [Oscillospiraceae bacterium]|nr:hypothetical protein [Oscillospiraceae bacterium]
MEKKKTSGELLDILRNTPTFADGQKEIRSEQITESLAQYLNELVVRRKAKLPDVMRRSGLKKAYFYSLFDGKRQNPSRDVLIQLGFGFEMSFDEIQDFLRHHGAAQLYPRIPRDSVIIYSFQHGLNLIDCDALLLENGERLLTKA